MLSQCIIIIRNWRRFNNLTAMTPLSSKAPFAVGGGGTNY